MSEVLEMSFDIDSFINEVEPNVDFTDKSGITEEEQDLLQVEFEKLVKFDNNKGYASCYPVVVYTLKKKPVAWYDIEMQVGYIK